MIYIYILLIYVDLLFEPKAGESQEENMAHLESITKVFVIIIASDGAACPPWMDGHILGPGLSPNYHLVIGKPWENHGKMVV